MHFVGHNGMGGAFSPKFLTIQTQKNGTFVCNVTRQAGAPTCTWQFADGTTQTGDSCSKAMNGTLQNVVVKINPSKLLTFSAIGMDVVRFLNLPKCVNLRTFNCYQSANKNPLIINLSALAGMTALTSLNLSSGVYTADITGVLNSLPPTDISISLVRTAALPGSVPFGLAYLTTRHCAWNQAQVNQMADFFYDNRASFTRIPSIDINGTNAAPSAAQIAKLQELKTTCGWDLTWSA